MTAALAPALDGLMGLGELRELLYIAIAAGLAVLVPWLHCASFVIRPQARRTLLAVLSAVVLLLESGLMLALTASAWGDGSITLMHASGWVVAAVIVGAPAFVPLRRPARR